MYEKELEARDLKIAQMCATIEDENEKLLGLVKQNEADKKVMQVILDYNSSLQKVLITREEIERGGASNGQSHRSVDGCGRKGVAIHQGHCPRHDSAV